MDKRLILESSNKDKFFINKDTIFIDFSKSKKAISSSVLNGSYQNNLKSVFNHKLPKEYLENVEENNLKEYLSNLSKKLGLNPKYSSGLVTSADIENLSYSIQRYKKLEVIAISTAGVKITAARAGDPASYYEENLSYQFNIGTINIILLINANLTDEAMVTSLITATEAKTVALEQLAVASFYSNYYATGTGTDGIILVSDKHSNNNLQDGGKHSKLGELIGKAVIESVKNSLAKEMWLTPKSQANVLVRLNRFKIDINEFYKDMDEDKKIKFIKKLSFDSKKLKNVEITSLVLHLIDEYNYKLITRDVAYDLAIKIIKLSPDKTIRDILNFFVKKLIKK